MIEIQLKSFYYNENKFESTTSICKQLRQVSVKEIFLKLAPELLHSKSLYDKLLKYLLIVEKCILVFRIKIMNGNVKLREN